MTTDKAEWANQKLRHTLNREFSHHAERCSDLGYCQVKILEFQGNLIVEALDGFMNLCEDFGIDKTEVLKLVLQRLQRMEENRVKTKKS